MNHKELVVGLSENKELTEKKEFCSLHVVFEHIQLIIKGSYVIKGLQVVIEWYLNSFAKLAVIFKTQILPQ